MPLPLLLVLVVLAVLAGFFVGGFISRTLGPAAGKGGQGAGGRARQAVGRTAVRLWRWQRDQRKRRDDQEE